MIINRKFKYLLFFIANTKVLFIMVAHYMSSKFYILNLLDTNFNFIKLCSYNTIFYNTINYGK